MICENFKKKYVPVFLKNPDTCALYTSTINNHKNNKFHSTIVKDGLMIIPLSTGDISKLLPYKQEI